MKIILYGQERVYLGFTKQIFKIALARLVKPR